MAGDFFLGGGAGPGVGLEDVVEAGVLQVGVPFHDGFDDVPDGGEEDLFLEEGGDGDFVGGIEDGGERAASFMPASRARRRAGNFSQDRGLRNGGRRASARLRGFKRW